MLKSQINHTNIGLTLKCQLKRYLCCHHVLLLLLMLSKNSEKFRIFGGKFKCKLQNAKCKYKCKHKIFAQTQNFCPNPKILPKPKIFAQTQKFSPNPKFSPKPKIFAQTQHFCANPNFLPEPKIVRI